jgi:hypothetical protein
MLRLLVVSLIALASSARANDVQNIYDGLPKLPAKVADELDCRPLSDASAALHEREQAAADALNARAEKEQAAFMLEVQNGRAKMDVAQLGARDKVAQEMKDADPRGTCIDPHATMTAVLRPTAKAIHAKFEASEKTRLAGVKACPIKTTGEFTGPAQSCVQPIEDKAAAEREKFMTTWLEAVGKAYDETKRLNLVCIANAAAVNAKYFGRAKSLRFQFDPALELIQTTGMAAELTDSAGVWCRQTLTIRERNVGGFDIP